MLLDLRHRIIKLIYEFRARDPVERTMWLKVLSQQEKYRKESISFLQGFLWIHFGNYLQRNQTLTHQSPKTTIK